MCQIHTFEFYFDVNTIFNNILEIPTLIPVQFPCIKSLREFDVNRYSDIKSLTSIGVRIGEAPAAHKEIDGVRRSVALLGLHC